MNGNPVFGRFPQTRPRRLRQTEGLRALVRETRVVPEQLVMPYFVISGKRKRSEIASMPGQSRFSPDRLLKEAEGLLKAGVHTVLLFGIPDRKDAAGSEAWASKGVTQTAVRGLKKAFPELTVITDVCLCQFTDHGHCGVLHARGTIENDASLELLAQTALSHAEAGADIVAPSDMMDGRVQAIRGRLDKEGFQETLILSYAAKYASAFYGPFREAAHSAPKPNLAEPEPKRLSQVDTDLGKVLQQTSLKSFGPKSAPVSSSVKSLTKNIGFHGEETKGKIPHDRKSYQMDPANLKEALREIAMDLEEGADLIMVKPALAYLDVIREAARCFEVPLAAYLVSGEYAMIKHAAASGLVDERAIVLEILTAAARAGARILITYHAKEAAGWMRER